MAVPERPSGRAIRMERTGQHALWRVIKVELHSVRCLYVVARARGEGGGLSGKMHGRKSVQGLAMARREFGELTRFDCNNVDSL